MAAILAHPAVELSNSVSPGNLWRKRAISLTYRLEKFAAFPPSPLRITALTFFAHFFP
jgi:hypothetical protein